MAGHGPNLQGSKYFSKDMNVLTHLDAVLCSMYNLLCELVVYSLDIFRYVCRYIGVISGNGPPPVLIVICVTMYQ